MTEAVTIELIRASEVIIPSIIAGVGAYWARQAHTASQEVAHNMNSLLDARVQAADDLGRSEGKAEGVRQERDRGKPARKKAKG